MSTIAVVSISLVVGYAALLIGLPSILLLMQNEKKGKDSKDSSF